MRKTAIIITCASMLALAACTPPAYKAEVAGINEVHTPAKNLTNAQVCDAIDPTSFAPSDIVLEAKKRGLYKCGQSNYDAYDRHGLES